MFALASRTFNILKFFAADLAHLYAAMQVHTPSKTNDPCNVLCCKCFRFVAHRQSAHIMYVPIYVVCLCNPAKVYLRSPRRLYAGRIRGRDTTCDFNKIYIVYSLTSHFITCSQIAWSFMGICEPAIVVVVT